MLKQTDQIRNFMGTNAGIKRQTMPGKLPQAVQKARRLEQIAILQEAPNANHLGNRGDPFQLTGSISILKSDTSHDAMNSLIFGGNRGQPIGFSCRIISIGFHENVLAPLRGIRNACRCRQACFGEP